MMLQQTQVETVIPFFHRFIGTFPDFNTLANASEEEVLSHWSGLGYYRRARNLQACAKTIQTRYGGEFPTEKSEILFLPGIGPYTAGAILSIAFGRSEPLVDGNVERVLSRVFTLEEDLAKSRGKKAIWDLASQLLPNERAGDFNQAMMELGATLCRPANPSCEICPLNVSCRARRTSTVRRFPIKVKKRKSVKVEEILILAKMGSKWLLTNTNDESLYSGLWQFPWVWNPPGNDFFQCLKNLCQRCGVPFDQVFPFSTTKHTVTFRRIETQCFLARVPPSTRPKGQETGLFRWVELIDLERMPLPSYQKRLLAMLRDFELNSL
jgi:A/G-specific adenine glycosylase